jgi:hypothetical protein
VTRVALLVRLALAAPHKLLQDSHSSLALMLVQLHAQGVA